MHFLTTQCSVYLSLPELSYFSLRLLLKNFKRGSFMMTLNSLDTCLYTNALLLFSYVKMHKLSVKLTCLVFWKKNPNNKQPPQNSKTPTSIDKNQHAPFLIGLYDWYVPVRTMASGGVSVRYPLISSFHHRDCSCCWTSLLLHLKVLYVHLIYITMYATSEVKVVLVRTRISYYMTDNSLAIVSILLILW